LFTKKSETKLTFKFFIMNSSKQNKMQTNQKKLSYPPNSYRDPGIDSPLTLGAGSGLSSSGDSK